MKPHVADSANHITSQRRFRLVVTTLEAHVRWSDTCATCGSKVDDHRSPEVEDVMSSKVFKKIRNATMAGVGVASLALGAFAPSPVHADDGVIADFSGTTRLGVAQNAWHPWGPCRVRDMNGETWGWYCERRPATP